MRILTEGVKVTHLPWREHLVCSSKDVLDVDPQDGKFTLTTKHSES